MKRKSIKKVLTIVALTMAISIINPMAAKAEWKKDKIGWWYKAGQTYYKDCWQKINRSWYYFNDSGYMEHDRILNGYYVNSDGTLVTGSKEIQAYVNLLKQPEVLKTKYNVEYANYLGQTKENDVPDCDIIDIDGDGVYEAVFVNGISHANEKTSVFTYKDGQVELAGEMSGSYEYDDKSKAIIGVWSGQDSMSGEIYKMENGKLKEIHTYSVNDGYFKADMFIDGEKVTRQEVNEFFSQYGEAGKYFIIK